MDLLDWGWFNCVKAGLKYEKESFYSAEAGSIGLRLVHFFRLIPLCRDWVKQAKIGFIGSMFAQVDRGVSMSHGWSLRWQLV